MPHPQLPPCSILILAGGRGQRMGGQDKGLIAWQGRPLIAHVHQVARPLTDDLIISCNRNAGRYAIYADHLVTDDEADFPGPLAGILAGLVHARHDWLLVLPCDAPLVDPDLLQMLRETALDDTTKAVLVKQGEQWQPMFCLLPKSALRRLQEAWQTGERSPLRAFLRLGARPCPRPPDDTRLANLNTPELLSRTAPG